MDEKKEGRMEMRSRHGIRKETKKRKKGRKDGWRIKTIEDTEAGREHERYGGRKGRKEDREAGR